MNADMNNTAIIVKAVNDDTVTFDIGGKEMTVAARHILGNLKIGQSVHLLAVADDVTKADREQLAKSLLNEILSTNDKTSDIA